MKKEDLTEVKLYIHDDSLIVSDGETFFHVRAIVRIDSRTYLKDDKFQFVPIEMEDIK